MDAPEARIPPLRALDCTLVKAGGQELVRVRDGLGISPDALVPMPLVALLQLFDGRRSVMDVQAEIVRQTGEIVPSSELSRLINELDQAYLLDSDRFRDRLRQVLREWEESGVRPAAHAGGAYPEDPAEAARQLEAMYRRPGAADAGTLASPRKLRAVLAPHIDFHRGGHSYTWAYHELRRRGRAPLYVILGTCHQPMEEPFAITRKSYDTPWGPVAADGPFLDRLAQLYGEDLRRDEYNHKHEHSIEFQVVFLRHALGEAPFTIVPILCAGIHEALGRGAAPDSLPKVARFLDSLAAAIASTRAEGREVVLIGGVDLAHVGQHFGDRDRLTPGFLEEVRARDRSLLDRAAAVDSRGFFAEIARDGDRRRVCGAGAIYALLGLFERERSESCGVAGVLLHYDQAVDLENDLCVSFASMAFEDAGDGA